MSQEVINVALPETLKEYLLKQVAEGGYPTVSEYIGQLIRADQQRKNQERLEGLILEGLESGEPREMTEKDWEDLKRRVWERHAELGGK